MSLSFNPNSKVIKKGVLNACLYGQGYGALLQDVTYNDMVQIFHLNRQKRRIKFKHTRLNWNQHVKKLRHTKTFYNRYHMTEESFNKLVNILREDVTVDGMQSLRSSAVNRQIYPEMIVASGLRFLGGEPVKSLADLYGMSDSSTRRVNRMFIEAVISNNRLKIHLPNTPDKLKVLADGFDAVSGARGVFYGVIGAIDGWLCTTEKPYDVPNPGDFMSGHYRRFGLNVQAICDSNLRFMYVAVAAPGKTNDSRAYCRLVQLRTWIEDLCDTFFFVGDNAYNLTTKMLIPFKGSQKTQKYKRSYNFHLSQLRIRIEMAFGRLTTKWRIFRRNLEFSSAYNRMIIDAAFRLHNFVIEEDNPDFNKLNAHSALREWGVDTLHDGPDGNKGYIPGRAGRDASITNNTVKYNPPVNNSTILRK